MRQSGGVRTPNGETGESRGQAAAIREAPGRRTDRGQSRSGLAQKETVWLLLTLVWIFLTEACIMRLLQVATHSGGPGWGIAALDGAALTVAVAPIIYFLLFHPLRRTVDAERNSARALQELRDDLERQVQARTSELAAANDELTTEMRRSQRVARDLAESEANYSTLVENSLNGLFVYQEGKLVFANAQFAKMVGREKKELLQMDPMALVHPEERSRVAEFSQRRLAGEEAPAEYETRMLTKAGASLWVNVRATSVLYRGRPANLVTVLDVTKQKRALEELQESRKELHRLSGMLLRAQEEERARVANELHDTVIQALCRIKFIAESAVLGCDAGRCPQEFAALRSLVEQTRESIRDSRRIATGLRPQGLDEAGVLETVRSWSREFRASHPGIRVDLVLDVAEADVPEDLKLPIFRVVQEALTNVGKHSGAERVAVTLRNTSGALELTVEDDGRGFATDSVALRESSGGDFGLRTMRHRAEDSGGIFSVGSQEAQGAVVRAVWQTANGNPVSSG